MWVFYHDDGVLAGDVQAAVQALHEVEARTTAIGLRLNLAKCGAVAIGRTQDVHLAGALPPRSPGGLVLGPPSSPMELRVAWGPRRCSGRLRRPHPRPEPLGRRVARRYCLPRGSPGRLALASGLLRLRQGDPLNAVHAPGGGLAGFTGVRRRAAFTGIHPDTGQRSQASLCPAHGRVGLRPAGCTRTMPTWPRWALARLLALRSTPDSTRRSSVPARSCSTPCSP